MPQTPGGLRATFMVLLTALGTLVVGGLILIGGEPRFSGPSFASARQIAPWYVWGAVMLASGALAFFGAARHFVWVARIGHSVSSLVYIFWVVALAVTAVQLPTGPLTGIGIYSAFAAMHAFAAVSAELEREAYRAKHRPPPTL